MERGGRGGVRMHVEMNHCLSRVNEGELHQRTCRISQEGEKEKFSHLNKEPAANLARRKTGSALVHCVFD